MPIPPGTHKLGPADATLVVHTGRSGAAAKAGHDLVLHVASWEGFLEVGEDPGRTSIELSADPNSLRVHQGTGGMQALADKDKSSIQKTIQDEVLKGSPIRFRSTEVETIADGSRLSVRGELELAGESRPLVFELGLGPDGQLGASTTIRQSEWGIKPYSTLFGALKVRDEVQVALEPARRGGDQSA